jgi:hypothetical protein
VGISIFQGKNVTFLGTGETAAVPDADRPAPGIGSGVTRRVFVPQICDEVITGEEEEEDDEDKGTRDYWRAELDCCDMAEDVDVGPTESPVLETEPGVANMNHPIVIWAGD